jgi:hypothetical protein
MTYDGLKASNAGPLRATGPKRVIASRALIAYISMWTSDQISVEIEEADRREMIVVITTPVGTSGSWRTCLSSIAFCIWKALTLAG